jgi:hypothetical protein
MLVARIVVDVDGHGAQLRDFGLQGGEGVVVLPGWKVLVGDFAACERVRIIPFAFVGFGHGRCGL